MKYSSMSINNEQSTEDNEMVDWDVQITNPPNRPTKKIVAVLRKGSYRLPLDLYQTSSEIYNQEFVYAQK